MGGVRGGVDEGFLLFPNNDRCRRKVSAQTRLLDIKRVGKALPSGNQRGTRECTTEKRCVAVSGSTHSAKD